jgi:hypothetical protein
VSVMTMVALSVLAVTIQLPRGLPGSGSP